MLLSDNNLSGYMESLGVTLQLDKGLHQELAHPAYGDGTMNNESTCTSSEVISSFKSQIYHQFALHDGAIFFLNSHNEILPATVVEYNTSFFLTVKQLEEQGIIKSSVEKDSVLMIPRETISSFVCNEQVLILPMLLRTGIKAVFIGCSHGRSEVFTPNVIQLLKSITETTAVTLDTIRISEEIEALTTHVKVLNEQMAHSSKLASIGELTASVAHEINNPLQIMSAHLQLLEHGIGNNERRLEILREQCSRISNITRKLLEFSQAVPFENLAEPVNLYEVLESVLEFVSVQLDHDVINVRTHYDKVRVPIYGVQSQLEQVFLNVLLNAKDAMYGGGLLTVGLLCSESFATIVVSDNGCGMSSDIIGKIFEPRFTTKPKGKGSGYGLYISRTIIEQHNGNISVISEIGKGTTFKISLPILQVNQVNNRISRYIRK